MSVMTESQILFQLLPNEQSLSGISYAKEAACLQGASGRSAQGGNIPVLPILKALHASNAEFLQCFWKVLKQSSSLSTGQ